MDAKEASWAEAGEGGKIAAYVFFGIGGFLVLVGLFVLIYLLYVKRRGTCCCPKRQPVSKYRDDIGELPAKHHVNPRVHIVRENNIIVGDALKVETLTLKKQPVHEGNPRIHVVSESGDVFEDNLVSEKNVAPLKKVPNNPRVHIVKENGEIYEDNLINDSDDEGVKVHDYGAPVPVGTLTKSKDNKDTVIVSSDYIDYAMSNGSVSNTLPRDLASHYRMEMEMNMLNGPMSVPGVPTNRRKIHRKTASRAAQSRIARSEPILGGTSSKKTVDSSSNWILKGNTGKAKKTGTKQRTAKSVGHGTVLTSNKSPKQKRTRKYMVQSSIPVFPNKHKKNFRSYTPMHGSLNSLHSAGSFYVYNRTPVISLDQLPKAASRGHRFIVVDTGPPPQSRTHVKKWITQQHHHQQRQQQQQYRSDTWKRSSDPTHTQPANLGEGVESPRSEGVLHRVVRSDDHLESSYRQTEDSLDDLHLRWSPSMRRRRSLDDNISQSSFAIKTQTLTKQELGTETGIATATVDTVPNGDILLTHL